MKRRKTDRNSRFVTEVKPGELGTHFVCESPATPPRRKKPPRGKLPTPTDLEPNGILRTQAKLLVLEAEANHLRQQLHDLAGPLRAALTVHAAQVKTSLQSLNPAEREAAERIAPHYLEPGSVEATLRRHLRAIEID